MIILSWNIEHLRFEKVTRGDNWDTFTTVVWPCHVAFLYESKNAITCREIADKLNEDHIADDEEPWAGTKFATLDEYITCLYDRRFVSSVTLETGPTAAVGSVSGGERLPPVVAIKTPDGKSLLVAPWHGYGPAKTSTGFVLPTLTQKLAQEGVQLFFGDFNLQKGYHAETDTDSKRRRTSTRLAMRADLRELEAEGGIRTSTQTAQGPTNRSGPLDRCMKADRMNARMFQLDPLDCAAHTALTNHSPLFIFTDEDASVTNVVINDTLTSVAGYGTTANIAKMTFHPGVPGAGTGRRGGRRGRRRRR